MDVELRPLRGLYAALGGVHLLLGALIGFTPAPGLLRIAALAAVAFSAWSCLRVGLKAGEVRALRLEPRGKLSALVARRGEDSPRMFGVRTFRVPRFFRGYVELLLELDDGRKTAVLIFPGVCDAGAFRRLRKFLLRSKAASAPDKAFIRRLAEQLRAQLMSVFLRIKSRRNAERVA